MLCGGGEHIEVGGNGSFGLAELAVNPRLTQEDFSDVWVGRGSVGNHAFFGQFRLAFHQPFTAVDVFGPELQCEREVACDLFADLSFGGFGFGMDQLGGMLAQELCGAFQCHGLAE